MVDNNQYKKIYTYALGFLEKNKPEGINLAPYYEADSKCTTLEGVFKRFVISAQNYHFIPNVIGTTRNISRKEKVEEILRNYDIGYVSYPKPDVHLMDVFAELGLCKHEPLDTFEAVVKMAEVCGETPYKVDKVFWLICSGKYYKDDMENNKVRPLKREFIVEAKGLL
ncbi:hypothetical protein [Pseudobutyrivibrio sp.]